MVEYYKAAFPRVFFACINWAIGQGFLLTLVSAVGVLIASAFFASWRVKRGKHSWNEAMSDITRAFKDFALSLVFGSFCALIILYTIFFIQDAPLQLASAHKELIDTKSKYYAVTSPADIIIVDGGFRPLTNSNLFVSFANLFNGGQNAAYKLRLKLFYLNRNFVRLSTTSFNNANEIPGHAGYIAENDPQVLPIKEGAKYYVFAYVYEDRVSGKKYRRTHFLKFFGFAFGAMALKFEEPLVDEVSKLKEVLSDELAPYEDDDSKN